MVFGRAVVVVLGNDWVLMEGVKIDSGVVFVVRLFGCLVITIRVTQFFTRLSKFLVARDICGFEFWIVNGVYQNTLILLAFHIDKPRPTSCFAHQLRRLTLELIKRFRLFHELPLCLVAAKHRLSHFLPIIVKRLLCFSLVSVGIELLQN